MKEINSLKEIEKQSRILGIFTRVYLIMSMVTFIATFFREEYLVLFLGSIGLAILFNADLRYWNTKYYMIKNFNELKRKK